MTRYARARGSKASNERLPEVATSWSTMKQQIIESKFQKDVYRSYKLTSMTEKVIVNGSSGNSVSKVWEEFDTDSIKDSSAKKQSIKSKQKESLVSIQKKRKKKLKGNGIIGNDMQSKKISVKGNDFIISSKNKLKNDDDCIKHDIHLENEHKNVKIKKQIYVCEDSSYLENEFEIKRNDSNEMKNSIKKRKNSKCNEYNGIGGNSSIGKKINEKSLNVSGSHDAKASVFRSNDKFGCKKSRTHQMNTSNSRNFNKFNNKNISTMNIGGRMIEISDFQGFSVKKEDAVRLSKLRKDLILKGVPRKEVEVALKSERRRAEKALAREKKMVCYKCRKFGHNMSECPDCDDPSGVCFKCGSTEHSVRDCRVVQSESYRYAHCFICQEQGHISRQCPDNPRGLYPKGGACKVCGDVTHLKKDCPELMNEKENDTITVGTVQNNCIEVLDEDLHKNVKKRNDNKKPIFVKF